MKKLLSVVWTALAALCMCANAMAASSVLIKNNDPNMDNISYEYTADESETVVSIKPLMTKLGELENQESVVQTITISSTSEGGVPVLFVLRLSLPEAKDTAMPEKPKEISQKEYDALNYYNITVTDADNNVLSVNEEADGNSEYKDIMLGVLNQTEETDNGIFNLSVSVNDDMKNYSEKARDLDWSIISVPIEKSGAETADVIKGDEAFELQKGDYICGKDIPTGRYTMTGSGKVHVYDEENTLKTTIALKNKDDETAKGVAEYVITLKDGERLSLEERTRFDPYSPVKKSSVISNQEPKASDAASNAAVSTNTASKTNPKTGDFMPVWGLVGMAVVCCGMLAYLQVKKRDEN